MRLLTKPKSIASRLKLMNVLVSGSALLLALASFLAYDMVAIHNDLLHTLQTDSQLIGANVVSALMFDDRQAATQTLAALKGSPEVIAAELRGRDGKVFATYVVEGTNTEITPQPLPAKGDANWKIGRHTLYGSHIVFNGENVGTIYILAAPQAMTQRVLHYALIALLVLFLCMGLALLVTTRLRHALTRPLVGLADAAMIVRRKKDYSVRAPIPPGRDELASLVLAFNQMLNDIQLRDKELEQSRADLENRVEERTAELSEANKELEAFSYTVAHDLRGPLESMLNLGYLLEDEIDKRTESEGKLHLEEMMASARKMATLIQDLLNLSRATRQPSQREMVNLSTMASSILQTLQEGGPGRHVRITIAPGATVYADGRLLRVALENLLNNAWKYTSKLDDAAIEFGVTEKDGEPVYFVRDNGAGFDPKYTDRLFQPFQRLHVQSEFPGTGVGLATVSRIIQRHGGRIWAESSVGNGATFYFTLPYIDGKKAAL